MTEQGFNAITQCPKCESVAVHWLDIPYRAPEQDWVLYREKLAAWSPYNPIHVGPDGIEIHMFQGCPKPTPPVDELIFEVMRVCRECENRWGQGYGTS